MIQPIDPANGRPLCSPEHPMPKDATGRWSHTSVEQVGHGEDYGGGCYVVTYRCRDCGKTWEQELPQ